MTKPEYCMERFIVIDTSTGKELCRDYTRNSAQKCADECNDHEKRNGRPEVHVVRELDKTWSSSRKDMKEAK